MGLNPQVLTIVQSEGGRGRGDGRAPSIVVPRRTAAERRRRRRTAKAKERQLAGCWLPPGCNATREAERGECWEYRLACRGY